MTREQAEAYGQMIDPEGWALDKDGNAIVIARDTSTIVLNVHGDTIESRRPDDTVAQKAAAMAPAQIVAELLEAEGRGWFRGVSDAQLDSILAGEPLDAATVKLLAGCDDVPESWWSTLEEAYRYDLRCRPGLHLPADAMNEQQWAAYYTLPHRNSWEGGFDGGAIAAYSWDRAPVLILRDGTIVQFTP